MVLSLLWIAFIGVTAVGNFSTARQVIEGNRALCRDPSMQSLKTENPRSWEATCGVERAAGDWDWQRTVIIGGIAAAVLPPIGALAFGFVLAWIVRGFRPEPVRS
jgi:hypothetical protein